MPRRHWLALPSLLALTVGGVVLVAFALMRVSAQPLLNEFPVVAAASTLLVFILPAAIAGAIARAGLIPTGVLLGVIGAIFSALLATQFQPNWGALPFYQAIGFYACVNIPLCFFGAVAGHFVRSRA